MNNVEYVQTNQFVKKEIYYFRNILHHGDKVHHDPEQGWEDKAGQMVRTVCEYLREKVFV